MMMFGVNFFSLSFTTLSLLWSGEMWTSLAFLATSDACRFDVTLLAFTSATGQLFIFYTIKKFGPIVFTIMMTTRQMLSMIVSCLMYGHSLGAGAVLGSMVVFGTLFYKVRARLDTYTSIRSQSQLDLI